MMLEKLVILIGKKLVLTSITSCPNNTSRGITDKNLKAKTINLLEENMKKYLHDLGVGNYFF